MKTYPENKTSPGRRLKIFLFLSVISAGALYANMRQRWEVARHPSYFLAGVSGAVVESEDLSFSCDMPYEGDPDWDEMQKRGCDVQAVYRIASDDSRKFRLEFILPSSDPVSISINGHPVSTVPHELSLTETTVKAYRLSSLCHFCGNAISRLYAASFEASVEKGKNVIEARYRQPYGFVETAYGYFTTSKWLNHFSYELWPLKTWKISPTFQMNVKILVARPSWHRRLFNDSQVECRADDLQMNRQLPLPPYSETDNSFENWLKTSRDNSIIPLTRETSGNKAEYSTTFTGVFPDRLSCFLKVD